MLLPDGMLLPGFISVPLTLFVIVGITNAINLADGLDGLAGGLTLITFMCLCALAYPSGDYTVLFLCMVMFGVLIGFLNYNTFPATVFMGDAGSQILGFIAIVLSLRLTQTSEAISPLLPLLIVGFPIIDTLVVMLERARKGRPLFVADNNHFHHKLLKLNLYHSEAVFIIYLLHSLLVMCAYLLRFFSDWIILGVFMLLAGIVVGFFQFAQATDFMFKRSFQPFKVRLRVFKNRSVLLRLASMPLLYILPVLLLANCVMVESLPTLPAYIAAGTALIIAILWIVRFNKLSGLLRVVLYFSIPAVIYIRQDLPELLWGFNIKPLYPALFIICLLSALVVIRYDRRRTGFKPSPMDYLILLLAIIVPSLLAPIMDAQKTRAFLAQVLIFLYCYEIMLNQRRMGFNAVTVTTIGVLIIMAFKGIV
jgi:UDP-GlcNAc:undecaprenyl-phosphate GlcNAc-1-phosphate transferase